MSPPASPPRASAAPASFRIEPNGDANRLGFALHGELSITEPPDLWTELQPLLEQARPGQPLVLDLRGLSRVDANSMALLAAARAKLAARGLECTLVGASEAHAELLALFDGQDRDAGHPHKPKPESTIAQIGRGAKTLLFDVRDTFAFVGSMVADFVGLLRQPRTGNFREIPAIMERAGADALPIVLLINFLIGFVMGFQCAGVLKQYGANLYVADMVGISMTRELAPLMTAIIVCGRSGAAFAAELGTMKVSEEIDALRTMGFGPMRYLVFPRMIGLVLVVPLLVVLADVVSILGGMLVAAIDLDVGPRAYLTETLVAVKVWDVLSGLIKSVAFAGAIAVIACQQGFATSGGAEGVGRRTTTAVVATLFALIVIDAVFTVMYRVLGQ